MRGAAWFRRSAPRRPYAIRRSCSLLEGGAKTICERRSGKCPVGRDGRSHLLRLPGWEAEAPQRALQVAIGIPLCTNLIFCRSLSAHAVAEFNDDACCEPLPYPRRLSDERFVSVNQCTAKKIWAVRCKEGDGNLWSDPAYIEQCGEESCLITCREANKRFTVFPDDVVQIQLKRCPFRSGAQHCRKRSNAQPEAVCADHHGVVLDPEHRAVNVGVHGYDLPARRAARTARSNPLSAATAAAAATTNEEDDPQLHLAIALSLKEAQQRVKQIKLSSKSISTDGSEGRLLPNFDAQPPQAAAVAAAGGRMFDDKAANDEAARTGDGRLFSSYDTPDHGRLWVITDDIRGEGEGPITTVLFPEDY